MQLAERVLVTGSCSTARPRWSSAPPTAVRRMSRSASRSRSVTRRACAATASGSSRSEPARPCRCRRGRAGPASSASCWPSGTRARGRRGAGAGPALSLVTAVARQRALVAVVSDFRGPRDWRPPLVDLAARHDMLAVEIRDPREERLVDVGEVWFADPESGRGFGSTPAMRACARASPRPQPGSGERSRRSRRRSGLPCRALDSGDWLRTLAAHLGRRRR